MFPRAIHYGTGVFEGIRCYETAQGPVLFRLDAHLERFYASASVYGMRIPFARHELADAICELIWRHGFTSCYVRPICYRGSRTLGLLPDKCPIHVSILIWLWGSYLGNAALQDGVSVTISSWTKFHSSMMPTAAKACGQYLYSILATREAFHEGYDEALLLDTNGHICEGSGENIFLVKNKKLRTNDERHSILLGVTRDAVITLARDLGIPVEVQALTVRDLHSAEQALFTGTAVELTPIRSVDGRPIGQGIRGPITETLQRRFFDAATGNDPIYKGWLHPVPAAPKQAWPELPAAEGSD
jgi:branched-chain amino acid aminotransferase